MRAVRGVLATVASALLAVVPAAGALAQVSTAPPDRVATTASDDVVQRFAGCVAGGGTGDVLLLMDRSGSLQKTDPENARIDAAQYFVEQLDSDSTKNGTKVNVAVAGFDASYERLTDWMPAAGSSVAVDRTLDSLARSNTGVDTDYWNALTGARRELGAQRDGAGTHCSTIVWFTDGEYSIEPRSTLSDGLRRTLKDPKPYAPKNPLSSQGDVERAIATGEKDICRDGGVADQVRSQDISTITIALSAGTSKPDFGFLEGLTTGQGCGKITNPRPGEFLEVANIRDLVFAFDQTVNSAITQTEGVCTGTAVCEEGAHTFVLDGSIGSVHLLADSDAAGQRLTLVAPDGTKRVLKADSTRARTTLGEATVTSAAVGPQGEDGGSVYIDMTRSAGGSLVGRWQLVFSSPDGAGKTSRTNLKIYGDLEPVWTNRDKVTFVAGDPSSPLTFGVAHVDGSPVDPAELSDATVLSATLVADDGTETSLLDAASGSAMTVPTTADLDASATGPATVRVTLSVTTMSWSSGGKEYAGTTLEPVTKDFPVEVSAPRNYPTIGTSVTFAPVEEPRTVSAQLPVEGEGCAWVQGGPTWTTTPQDVSTFDFSASAASRDACASGPITLTLAPGSAGNGLVSGRITVMSLPDDTSASPVSQSVTLAMEMQRPVNEAVRWATLVAIFLLGILLPVGLLYLAKYLTAKVPGPGVAAGIVRGPVGGGAAFTDYGVPLRVDQLQTQPLDGQDRRNVVVGPRTLRARTGLGLTEPGYVVVDHGDGGARISGAGGTGATTKGGPRLPLAVQGQWCVALDQVSPHSGDVEVTVFTDASGSNLEEVLTNVRRDLVATVETLRARAPRPADGGGDLSGADAWTGTSHNSEGVDAWTAPAGPSTDPWTAGSSSGPSGDTGGTSPSSQNDATADGPEAGSSPPADPWASPPSASGPSGNSPGAGW